MVSKEQIAHDLTMVYMKNRYGVDVSGSIDIKDNYGTGKIETEHYPMASDPTYVRVGTGEKGMFGLQRKQRVQSGTKVDSLFSEMVHNYYCAYSHFYSLLCENDTDGTDYI